MLPNFSSPGPGTLKEFLDNDINIRDKMSLNGLGVTKFETRILSMIMKTGMVGVED